MAHEGEKNYLARQGCRGSSKPTLATLDWTQKRVFMASTDGGIRPAEPSQVWSFGKPSNLRRGKKTLDDVSVDAPQ